MEEQTFDEQDKLSKVDLELVEEAFDKIDLAVDRMTKSGALVRLWSDLHGLLEFNGINK